jgi:3-deoxy-manno-octulosonate cytidylyltransferase (CMP-KDO synthetase)
LSNSFVVIIPSRLASSRLPRKPLADIDGKSLIRRVYDRAIQSNARKVYIATDSEEIFDHIKDFSDDVVMTSEKHLSGTDRIQETAEKLCLDSSESIINLQGDEPFVPIELINGLAKAFSNSDCDVGTVVTKCYEDDLSNPNTVKVALSHSNKALYFSRSLIPNNFIQKNQDFYRHIGIYAYKKATLDRLINLPTSALEKAEKLEQLRFIENGFTIQASIYDAEIPPGVDTLKDLESAINFIKNVSK